MMMKNTNIDSISTALIDLPRLCSRDVHTGDTSLLLKEQNYSGNTRNLLVLFVVSCTCYLDVLFCLFVCSVSDKQTCLLENWQSVYRISGLVSLGQVCTQALLFNYSRSSVAVSLDSKANCSSLTSSCEVKAALCSQSSSVV